MYKISEELIKHIEKIMKHWRVEWTIGGKSLGQVKIQTGIITITICNRYDATQPQTQKMHSQLSSYLIARKAQSPNAHGQHQTVY